MQVLVISVIQLYWWNHSNDFENIKVLHLQKISKFFTEIDHSKLSQLVCSTYIDDVAATRFWKCKTYLE